MGTLFDSLEGLGLKCCVVGVMGVMGVGWVGALEGMHFSQSKNALLFN